MENKPSHQFRIPHYNSYSPNIDDDYGEDDNDVLDASRLYGQILYITGLRYCRR